MLLTLGVDSHFIFGQLKQEENRIINKMQTQPQGCQIIKSLSFF